MLCMHQPGLRRGQRPPYVGSSVMATHASSAEPTLAWCVSFCVRQPPRDLCASPLPRRFSLRLGNSLGQGVRWGWAPAEPGEADGKAGSPGPFVPAQRREAAVSAVFSWAPSKGLLGRLPWHAPPARTTHTWALPEAGGPSTGLGAPPPGCSALPGLV